MVDDGRHLAVVMFTDMVGFTAMMQTDESTARAKRTRYVEAMDRCHAEHGGTIVQWFGDGALSTFPSAAGAIRAAIAIQTMLRQGDAVDVRLGLHLGDVIVEGDNILGDAVNIASRIESFSVPGAVVVSDTVHDQVKNQADIDFAELGTFRLKNVGRPFSLHAVADDRLVVPEPGHMHGKGQTALVLPETVPESRGRLVGRDRALAELVEQLDRHRLVTVTGPGGMGKTVLAIAAVEAARSRFAAVGFVPLASVTDPEDLLPTIAETLDMKEAEDRSALEAIADSLSDQPVLLVLDNLEQVEEPALVISQLLGSCRGLRVIATSRGPLHLGEEHVFALAALDAPQDDSVEVAAASDAVTLFVEAAARARPGFALSEENAASVAAICRFLDGLPLALELAAARLRILTPDGLAARLDDALSLLGGGRRDAADRHRTLRSTIEWSHGLLDEAAQQVFRRLSVFATGATLAGVEAVCGGVLPVDELDTLVDLSLVHVRGDRFTMLQTIDLYAREQLAGSGEAEAIADLHSRHMLEVADTIRRDIDGGDQVAGVERGMATDADLIAALDRCVAAARAGNGEWGELGLQLTGHLWSYWHFRGKHLTAEHYTTTLLDLTDPTSTPGRCGALLTLGLAQWTLGHIDASVETWRECHERSEAIDLVPMMGKSAFGVGVGYMASDLDEALAWTTRSTEIAQRVGDEWMYGFALGFRAFVVALRGDVAEAAERFAEALAIQRRIGDFEGAGFALGGLAFLRSLAGETQQAAGLYEEARASYATIGDRAEEARILGEMAWVYHADGAAETARARFLDAAAAYRDVGSVRGVGKCLVGLAATAGDRGLHETALTIAAAAEVFAADEGIVNAYADTPGAEDHIAASRSALEPEVARAAVATGRSLDLESVLRLA